MISRSDLPFRRAARDVVDGARVAGGPPHEHDPMDRGVGGAVAAPGESVPLMLTRRRGDGCSSAQGSELLFAGQSFGVVTAGDQKLAGDKGADAGQLQQSRVDLGGRLAEPRVDSLDVGRVLLMAHGQSFQGPAEGVLRAGTGTRP